MPCLRNGGENLRGAIDTILAAMANRQMLNWDERTIVKVKSICDFLTSQTLELEKIDRESDEQKKSASLNDWDENFAKTLKSVNREELLNCLVNDTAQAWNQRLSNRRLTLETVSNKFVDRYGFIVAADTQVNYFANCINWFHTHPIYGRLSFCFSILVVVIGVLGNSAGIGSFVQQLLKPPEKQSIQNNVTIFSDHQVTLTNANSSKADGKRKHKSNTKTQHFRQQSNESHD